MTISALRGSLTMFIRKFGSEFTVTHNCLFFFGFLTTYSSFAVIINPEYDSELEMKDWIICAIFGLVGILYQCFWKMGCTLETNSMAIALLMNTEIVFNLVYDYFLLGENITVYKILGAVIIIVVSILIVQKH